MKFHPGDKLLVSCDGKMFKGVFIDIFYVKAATFSETGLQFLQIKEDLISGKSMCLNLAHCAFFQVETANNHHENTDQPQVSKEKL